jgi:hypothetical protein
MHARKLRATQPRGRTPRKQKGKRRANCKNPARREIHRKLEIRTATVSSWFRVVNESDHWSAAFTPLRLTQFKAAGNSSRNVLLDVEAG